MTKLTVNVPNFGEYGDPSLLVTLDHLSGGRLILGVGLGDPVASE